MSKYSDTKQGTLRILLLSAGDLPGGVDLSCSIDVGHGENGGSTHCLPECGPNPIFNAAFSFPYDKGETVEFTVKDGETGKIIAEGFLNTDQAVTNYPWSGDVKLRPTGYIRVSMDFSVAPENPPPKATVTITRGVDFTDTKLEFAGVTLALDGKDVRITSLVNRDSDGIFVWNQPFEFDYSCEQMLTIQVLNKFGSKIADASYELWTFQNQGLTTASGQLAVADANNRTIGRIGIQIILWSTEKIAVPQALPPPASQVTQPHTLNLEPQLSNTESNNSNHLVPFNQSCDSAEEPLYNLRMTKGATLRLPPEPRKPTEGTEKSINNVVEVGNSSTNSSENARLVVYDGTDSSRQTKEAAKQVLEQAASNAMAVAKEAARRAALSAEVAAELAEILNSSVAKEKASGAAIASRKAAEHTKKCEHFSAKVKDATSLDKALNYLKHVEEEAKAANYEEVVAEGASKGAIDLEKKQQKRNESRKNRMQQDLALQERGLKSPYDGKDQVHKPEKKLKRQTEESLSPYERAIQGASLIYSYNVDYTEPSISYDSGIPPAVCCYIPQSHSKLENHPSVCDTSPSSSRHSLSPYRDNNRWGTSTRYHSDIAAYGLPDPELDVLIEGEMQNPMCCMCCGLRWNKCQH